MSDNLSRQKIKHAMACAEEILTDKRNINLIPILIGHLEEALDPSLHPDYEYEQARTKACLEALDGCPDPAKFVEAVKEHIQFVSSTNHNEDPNFSWLKDKS